MTSGQTKVRKMRFNNFCNTVHLIKNNKSRVIELTYRQLFIERSALELEKLPFALFAGYKELELRMLRGICHPPTTWFLNRYHFASEYLVDPVSSIKIQGLPEYIIIIISYSHWWFS